MKNRLQLAVIILIALGSFTSCKKKVATCKLSRIFTSDGTTTPMPAVFTYNEDGTLRTIVYPTLSSDSFIYSSNGGSIQSFDKAGHLTGELTGPLNSSGYFTSAVKISYDLLGNGSSQLQVFSYNGESNLTGQSLGSDVLSLQYLAGNTVSGTYEHNGLVRTRYEFFHNTIANKTGVDDLNGVYQPYLGKPSANLLDSLYIIDLNANDTTRIKYAHTLNADDYINTTKVQTYGANGVTTRYIAYQYRDCN